MEKRVNGKYNLMLHGDRTEEIREVREIPPWLGGSCLLLLWFLRLYTELYLKMPSKKALNWWKCYRACLDNHTPCWLSLETTPVRDTDVSRIFCSKQEVYSEVSLSRFKRFYPLVEKSVVTQQLRTFKCFFWYQNRGNFLAFYLII